MNVAQEAGPYLEFVREVRRNSRLFNVPTVLLAETAALEKADTLYETGITDAIAKPFPAGKFRSESIRWCANPDSATR